MKYVNLAAHLASLDGKEWNPTFHEVEAVLGFPLPDSARSYPAWWANQGRSQSQAWQSAGWRTASVDVPAERVTFIYVGGDDAEAEEAPRGLTIAQAKEGLAAQFGVDPDRIEIIIRG